MRRREFFTLLGGAAAAWPLVTRAQPATPVVGFYHTLSPEDVPTLLAAFRQGLKEVGFVEGQTVAVEYRWAQGKKEQLGALGADLVSRQVTVLVAAGGEPSPQIAKQATQTIPIVFSANGDPVSEGLVASLSRPNGNLTGITIFGPSAVTKRLQLLQELIQHDEVATFAYLTNPNSPNSDIELRTAETAVRSLGKKFLILRASTETELETALTTIDKNRVGALVVASDTFFFGWRDKIVSLVARRQIPAIYYLRGFAQAGGLISYGNSLDDMYRQIGIYTGRILKGEKPADLPVQQSTKFELTINLKTAKALGLIVSPQLLAQADEVIE
jgi:putative tryptophan/tyrosine transport system substrate-binding protein